jgi:hypothetical protein
MVVTLPGACTNGDLVFHTTTSTGSSVALAMNYGLPSDVDHKRLAPEEVDKLGDWNRSVQQLRDVDGTAIKGLCQ